ncbi:hypothetical protein AB0K51_15655 [Kitasatospora sp. NPDC049285]|uniref:hypothetical protein n=1 Tax=Kitasatospora sp. NPDC049285 TaxID=3157096 RepID=UPI00341386C5
MGEVPGARAELERFGQVLRAQLVALMEELTPGATDSGRLPLGAPEAVEGHEPSAHAYSVVFHGERPDGVRAADAVSRAAQLLGAAGWEATGPQEEGNGPSRRYVLTALHPDGIRIEIRSGDGGPGVLHSGRTPAVALREPEQARRPEPVRTPETVTPGFVLRYECDGLGACDHCGGRGWVPGEPRRRERCRVCFARRVCPICQGAGELAISDLSTYQLGYYPGL